MNKIDNDKILEVKNLRISFRTNTGTVKAVRGIDFTLRKGRTLAIVGESGSGKSVTSKAILGILANNKIVEGGQIIFDGKDLLKVTEDQFTKIRGVKISMIFQDPLSSLNPIMKVGKQLTEAMYLKAIATRKDAQKYLNGIHKIITIANKNNSRDVNNLINSIKKIDVIKNTKKVTVNVEEVRSNIKQLVENNTHLFVNAINLSLENQKTSIEHALSAVSKYQEICFTDYASFNVKKARAELKKIVHVINQSTFDLQIEADNIIEVFASSLNFFLDSYEDSIKQTIARDKLLNKYKVNTVHELPADVRAGQREIIVDKEEHYQSMIDLINQLCEHFNSILINLETNTDVERLTEQLTNHYVEQIISSKTVLTQEETKARAIKLLEEVGIPEPERRFYQYPFEFSGGMRQRIVIAIALSSNPEVLICDEPTTALDVTIQAQILELINRLKQEKNLSIIFITHDLGVVANMADDIAVMYAGKIVEYGTVYDIFYDPRHPYTWALLGSMPDLQTSEKLDAIPGTPPNMLLPPVGDAFAARNKYALKIDYLAQPPFYEISPTHYSATWLCDEYAPDVDAPEIVKNRILHSLENNPENYPNFTLDKNSILKNLKK